MIVSTEGRQPDSDAFIKMFISHQRQIYAFIGSLLPQQAELDDIYQQTCLLLWQKRDQYDPNRPFLPWAYGFARNEIFSFLRRQGRDANRLSPDLLAQIAEVRAVEDEQAAARRAALEACLQKLSPAQQELLKARYASSTSLKELAGSLATTAAALTMRLQRIRQALLQCIEATVTGVMP
jgi:RNA polymerase sigma-70 factor (ECF subfamily)